MLQFPEQVASFHGKLAVFLSAPLFGSSFQTKWLRFMVNLRCVCSPFRVQFPDEVASFHGKLAALSVITSLLTPVTVLSLLLTKGSTRNILNFPPFFSLSSVLV